MVGLFFSTLLLDVVFDRILSYSLIWSLSFLGLPFLCLPALPWLVFRYGGEEHCARALQTQRRPCPRIRLFDIMAVK